MPVEANIFGAAYLDTDNFRQSQSLFGVGMAMCDYPANDAGDAKLLLALAAA